MWRTACATASAASTMPKIPGPATSSRTKRAMGSSPEPWPWTDQRCTCSICPTGASYSSDFTFKRLLERKSFALHDQTLIRRLALDETKSTIVAAQGLSRTRPEELVEYRAPLFVLASGYCWTPHLLLL